MQLRNVTSLGAGALLVCAVGCSSSSKGGAQGGAGGSPAGTGGATTGTGGGNGAGGSTQGTGGAGAPGCPQGSLQILFSPMYSAYDGVHTFQVPAVVNGIDPTTTEVDWSASDPSMVVIAQDPTTGGAMITTQASGQVTIYAKTSTACGSSLLTITAATSDDWEAGSARYNDGVVLSRLPRTGPDGGRAADGGAPQDAASAQQAECTSCHGDTAATGPFKTVQHTPEQTGGFSDADLMNIFENGMVPQGGYFDTAIVPYNVWQGFHKWDVGDSAKGLVVYLRSLVPAAQTGSANFGGRFDGGFPDGGFTRDGGLGRDGGFGRGGAGGRAAGGDSGTNAGGAGGSGS